MLPVFEVGGDTRLGELSFFSKRENDMGAMQEVRPTEDRNLVQAAITPNRAGGEGKLRSEVVNWGREGIKVTKMVFISNLDL